jgi:hypothetical protein
MTKWFPLRVGAFYYFVEESIYPVGEMIHWLMQLKDYVPIQQQERGKSIVFTVLVTNRESFCNPGLSIADINCTDEQQLFHSHSAMIMEEVTWADFGRFLNFPLLDRDYCTGPGRIFYHEKFAELCPRECLPLLIGNYDKLDKVIAERLKQ